MPYNPNFQWKRKTITISVPTSSLPAGYQVKIIIPKESEMQSDFRDLRFETTSGYGLSHWLESINTTPNPDEATVWVKLKDIATVPTTVNIYMYYGNPYVASASNGSNTFDLFDEFSSGSTPDSNIWNITGAVTISNGLLVTTADNIRVNSKTTWTTPIILKYSARNTSSGGASYSRHGLINGSNTITASVHQIGVQDDGGSGAAGWYTDFYLTSLDQVSRGSSNTSFHTYIITWNPGILASIQRDGGTVYTGQIPSGAQALNVMLGDKDTEVEYVQVRKYVATEPTVPTAIQIAGLIAETIPLNSKRKRIIINTTTIPANYQIKLTIPFAPEMNMDFSDLRFVTKNNPTSLSYWIESSTPGVEAIVWIKLIDALTAQSDYIYMHYGNPNLTSASNVSNTFIREITGVVGAWNLNGDTLDRSGNGNNGTAIGSFAYTPGKFYNAGSFNGSNSYINLGTSLNSMFLRSKPFSISLWVNTAAATGGELFTNADWTSPYTGIEFVLQANGLIRFDLDQDATKLIRKTSTATINNGQWRHIVITYNGSGTASGVILYIDGTVASSTTNYDNTDADTTSITNLQIGGRDGANYLANGLLSLIRCYNRVMTQAEITDVYNNYGYVTTSYINKELVRKYVTTEPTIDYTTAPESMNTFFRRKKLTINNSSGSALTDYQIPITVAYDSDMQTNFNDIRFVDINNNLLPYWIESKTDSTTALFWIKVNLATGDNTVYMYYGNPNAASASNVGNTFIREISGVVGAWDLNGDVLDRSGVGNNGTAVSMSYVAGKFAQAGYFSGSGYIQLASSSGLSISSSWSMSAWVKATAWGTYPGIIMLALGDGGGTTYDSGIVVGANHSFALTKGLNNFYGSASAPSTGTWYHVVGTWNGTAGKLYANAQDITGTKSNGWYDSYGNIIGSGDSSEKFQGTIEKVRVYNKVLTPTEVSDIYGSSSDRFGYTTTNYAGKELVRKYASPEPTVTSTGTEENITATLMTITPTSPVGLGTTITVNVTWTSTVETTEFIPKIIIGNTTYSLPPITLLTGTNVVTFEVIGLPVGIHSICPDPN